MELMTYLKHQQPIMKKYNMDTNVAKFQNWNINKNKINHNYDNHIESKWTVVKFIVKDIKVGKPNHLLQQFNFQFNL